MGCKFQTRSSGGKTTNQYKCAPGKNIANICEPEQVDWRPTRRAAYLVFPEIDNSSEIFILGLIKDRHLFLTKKKGKAVSLFKDVPRFKPHL